MGEPDRFTSTLAPARAAWAEGATGTHRSSHTSMCNTMPGMWGKSRSSLLPKGTTAEAVVPAGLAAEAAEAAGLAVGVAGVAAEAATASSPVGPSPTPGRVIEVVAAMAPEAKWRFS